ncbi:MAG: glycosyltransferase [Candidatus Kapabacteria bacterium]|nr:glycosyltransferase [Ignavibacteriota bacterium]MCW5884238.1 glycosyltransferase [Candidatus Kapabacteria bacterium]
MFQNDVSIVIVNYNVRDYLYKCLKSVEDAAGKLRIQTIVVDNNSQDGSIEFLEPLFPQVKFISSYENLGFSKANNLGFTFASGKYILILNPDTILQENTLDVMYDYMENHTEVGISVCKILNADGSFQAACRRGFPTPWASFCKLFGLQTLFPKSKLFGRYNQTFLSVDETYYTEAVSGAFMFARADVIREVGGFDTDFFMYGEDIDLCYRSFLAGYKNAYVHTTSIIHYKGESSKRSSLDDIKIFYNAMEIFARKHYAGSTVFLKFMRLGIKIRSAFAYALKYKRDMILIAADSIFLILSLFVGTYIVFGDILGFPDYAYPTVFILPVIVLIISMILAGEYFEESGSIASSVFGYAMSFLALSTLTYFFTEYRFSRGTLLSTIGLSIIFSTIFRIFLNTFKGKHNVENVRAVFVGSPENFSQLLDDFRVVNPLDITIAGYVSDNAGIESNSEISWLGSIRHLDAVIKEHKINNIIISDPEMTGERIMGILTASSIRSARYHLAHRYEDFVASQLINNITYSGNSLPKYNINLIRYKIIKRIFDISIPILCLMTIFPLFILKSKGISLNEVLKVLFGRKTFIGIKSGSDYYSSLKVGLISLADMSSVGNLPEKAIRELNEYYLKNYSVTLDLEILIKYLFVGR